MFARWIARLGHRRWFAALGSRVLPGLDRAVYHLSGRRWMVASVAFPTLLLHCGGTKPVPLLYARDAESYLVAATNWGKPEHPAWSTRLIAGRRPSVEAHGVISPVTVALLSPDEVTALWPRLLEVWPAFETYRTRAHRDIRVFRLTRF